MPPVVLMCLSFQENCVELCVRKHVKVNHKIMGVFMELQPLIVSKRMEEMNQQALLMEQQIAQVQAAQAQTEASQS